MDGWNTSFVLGTPTFRGYVSFREGNPCLRTRSDLNITPSGSAAAYGDGRIEDIRSRTATATKR